jgi:hypothetical protein
MILGANELTNTDATRTNPITNESRLFDTFAPLNIAKVTINLDATNEYCEDALNNVIIQRKDGLQIAFDDWEIDDDEGIRRIRCRDDAGTEASGQGYLPRVSSRDRPASKPLVLRERSLGLAARTWSSARPIFFRLTLHCWRCRILHFEPVR